MKLARILPRLVQRDATAPAVTYYDDASGERIELSAKVVSMWASKASHWLTDEMLVDPGGRVHLDLPARHWRTIYWAFAVWSIGAEVSTTEADSDATVSMHGVGDLVEPVASLAASDLAGFPDQFGPSIEAAPDDLALDGRTFADVLPAVPASERVMLVDTDAGETLRITASTLAAAGSVVLVRNEDESRRARRVLDEGVDRVVSDSPG